ncbi:MAG: U32 family peptidase [Clostridia bacterium]|nr:U32 family peptidase [Clostridia bacterium]
MIELLSPAGSPKAMVSAVNAGADAVYFGGSSLNARQAATNFKDEELKKWVSFCHKRGVKCYLTLNTVVSDREIKDMAEYLRFITDCNIDAVIVQSIGLIKVIKSISPEMQIHASTQMSIHNKDGVNVAHLLGASRAVVARELSKSDLKSVCEEGIEIESFIHGALCMSYSGQCYLSSLIGQRSGNRGMCAQPCRQKYKNGYELSLKDLSVAEHFTDFLSTGVKSLKIEGRLKSPEYVGGVTSIYRKLIDQNRNATPKETDDLKKLFSRSGFTNGYFNNVKGKSMFGIRTEKDKEKSKGFSLKIPKAASKPEIVVKKRPTTTSLPEIYGLKYKKSVYNFHFLKESQLEGMKYLNLANHIWLPLFEIKNFKDERLGAILPSVIFDSQREQIKKKLVSLGIKKALCRTISHISLCRELGIEPHGAFTMNFYNSYDLAAAKEIGLKETAVSIEAKLAQIRDMKKPMPVNAVVYGKIPVMTTENCIIKNASSCKNYTQGYILSDKHASFDVICEYGHRNIILNSVPINLSDKIGGFSGKDIKGLEFLFTTETKKEIEKIIESYQKGLKPTSNFTRGLYFK